VREVAPSKNAKTDEKLGVGVYETEYMQAPVFYDSKAQIISALGEKVGVGSIFSMLWKISAALARMKEKKIEGNQVGDYSRKGGILVVGRGGGFHGFTMEGRLGEPLDWDKVKADFANAMQSR